MSKVRCKRTGQVFDLPDGHERHWYDEVPHERQGSSFLTKLTGLTIVACIVLMGTLVFLSYLPLLG
jgi:hypothetical protein